MSIIAFAATYDSVPLEVVESGQPRYLIGLVRGLDESPEVRGSDTIIPGTAGRIERNRVRDRRVIELRGWVMGTGVSESAQRADMRTAFEELRTLFDPTRSAATLSIELEDGGTATISARPINLVTDEPVVATRREVSIELEAVDADWVITPATS